MANFVEVTHVGTEKEELVAAGYNTPGHKDSVTICAICGEELARTKLEETEVSLKDQAAEAYEAAQEAVQNAAGLTGQSAVAANEGALKLAEEAKVLANQALEAAQAEGLPFGSCQGVHLFGAEDHTDAEGLC